MSAEKEYFRCRFMYQNNISSSGGSSLLLWDPHMADHRCPAGWSIHLRPGHPQHVMLDRQDTSTASERLLNQTSKRTKTSSKEKVKMFIEFVEHKLCLRNFILYLSLKELVLK